MVTQQAISVRMDLALLEELELEASLGTGGGKKNRIINDAVRHYLHYLDTQRMVSCESNYSKKLAIINDYEDEQFTL